MVAATVATVLFADTIGTSLVSASNTAAMLVASAAINAAVCWTAARTLRLAVGSVRWRERTGRAPRSGATHTCY